MMDWLKKKLGYHICEEFTQWELKIEEYIKYNTIGGIVVSEIPLTQTVQERKCTLCGKTYREFL